MTDWFNALKQPRCFSARKSMTQTRVFSTAGAALVAMSLWASPSLAKDPFRSTNPKPISDRTESAFRALFEQGDYSKAAVQLKQADTRDPLTHALTASLAYLAWESEKDATKKPTLLEQFKATIDQTRSTAQQLSATDAVRGNLYLAVGHFLQGAYIFTKEGTVKGTPLALNEVQRAFQYLNTAEAKSPNDPEVNLIKGYMDLFMALNLPFSSPTKAIERLEKFAAPRYLADRGIAIGYRDLNQPTKALVAVDRAIQLTPNNPELLYLKAQILVMQGNNRDSIPLFEKALTKQNQLPPGLVRQITRELKRSQTRLGNVGK